MWYWINRWKNVERTWLHGSYMPTGSWHWVGAGDGQHHRYRIDAEKTGLMNVRARDTRCVSIAGSNFKEVENLVYRWSLIKSIHILDRPSFRMLFNWNSDYIEEILQKVTDWNNKEVMAYWIERPSRLRLVPGWNTAWACAYATNYLITAIRWFP